MNDFAIGALEPLLSDPEPRIRKNALSALAALGTTGLPSLAKAALPSKGLDSHIRQDAERMLLALTGDDRRAAAAILSRYFEVEGEDADVAARLAQALSDGKGITPHSILWAFKHRWDIGIDATTRLMMISNGTIAGLVGGVILLGVALWYLTAQALPTVDSFYIGVPVYGAVVGAMMAIALSMSAKPAAAYPRLATAAVIEGAIAFGVSVVVLLVAKWLLERRGIDQMAPEAPRVLFAALVAGAFAIAVARTSSIWMTFRRSTSKAKPIYLIAVLSTLVLLAQTAVWLLLGSWWDPTAMAASAVSAGAVTNPEVSAVAPATGAVRSDIFAPMMFLATLPAVLATGAASLRLDAFRPVYVVQATRLLAVSSSAARALSFLAIVSLPFGIANATPDVQLDESALLPREAPPGAVRVHRFALTSLPQILIFEVQFAQHVKIEIPQSTDPSQRLELGLSLEALSDTPGCRSTQEGQSLSFGSEPARVEMNVPPGCYAVRVEGPGASDLRSTFTAFLKGMAAPNTTAKRPMWVEITLNETAQRPRAWTPSDPPIEIATVGSSSLLTFTVPDFTPSMAPASGDQTKDGAKRLQIAAVNISSPSRLSTSYLRHRGPTKWTEEYPGLRMELHDDHAKRIICQIGTELDGASRGAGESGPNPRAQAPWRPSVGTGWLPAGRYNVWLVNGPGACNDAPAQAAADATGSAISNDGSVARGQEASSQREAGGQLEFKDIRLANAQLTLEFSNPQSIQEVKLGPLGDTPINRDVIEVPVVFEFETDKDREIRIELADARIDLAIYLYDSQFGFLDFGDDPEILVRPLPAGKYNLLVQPYSFDWQSANVKLSSAVKLTIGNTTK